MKQILIKYISDLKSKILNQYIQKKNKSYYDYMIGISRMLHFSRVIWYLSIYTRASSKQIVAPQYMFTE